MLPENQPGPGPLPARAALLWPTSHRHIVTSCHQPPGSAECVAAAPQPWGCGWTVGLWVASAELTHLWPGGKTEPGRLQLE